MSGLNFPHGATFFDPQANQRLPFAQLAFTFAGNAPPNYISVYKDAALTQVYAQPITADVNGNWAPIYLDAFNSSGKCRVTLFASVAAGGAQMWAVDPYFIPFPMTIDSNVLQFGSAPAIGEVMTPAPASLQVPWTVVPLPGTIAIKLIGGGQVNGVAQPVWGIGNGMTGTRTATFTATNKPGIGTSAVVKWLPIQFNGVNYYTPVFS